jgi:hypothetical protein
MKNLIFISLAVLSLTACNDDASRCWSENTKSHVDSILKSAIADRVATVMGLAQTGNDKKSHSENVDDINSRLTVKTDSHAVDSINVDSGKVACTCGISVELSGGKKPFKSGGNIANYFVAKGEHGDVVSAQLDIVARVINDFEK